MPKCYSLRMETLREAVRLGRAQTPVALATVIRIVGSAPRHPGARMLIHADGSIFGTIGGGRVEQEVCAVGAEVASGSRARRVRYQLTQELGMSCGGGMEFYVEPIAPSLDAIERAVEILSRRRPVRMVTRFGGPKTAEELSDRGRGITVAEDHFAEVLRPRERVLLFGFGHIGRALTPLFATLDFDLVVCDDNQTGALSPPPECPVIESLDVDRVECELGGLGPADYAVIATREHRLDLGVLAALLPREDLGYLGMIGSRRKLATFRKQLADRGVEEHHWARLHSPIGLEIGGETPAEIALSIAAQIVMVRNRGEG